MITIQGKYNTALCYCDQIETAAAEQIRTVCDQEAFQDCNIRIMPDVHAGRGCTIGTTMTIHDKVVPAMVGVDIGCGMEAVRIRERDADFARLDALIHTEIPSGMEIRSECPPLDREADTEAIRDLEALRCAGNVNLNRARRSVGTLGGGNHFIELDRGEDGALWLVIHSGSRHLGVEVAAYYQEEGRKAMWGGARYQMAKLIADLKSQGRFREIQPALDELKKEHPIKVPVDLAYVEGKLFDDYLHDMGIVQRFALVNRRAMADQILRGMGWTAEESFSTIHNYIDLDSMILRKGAVSAKSGEKLLIPVNMRDGSLICIGKGNAEWNCSAPHGAGRRMSRKQAFAALSMEEYQAEMRGIYSTSVTLDTLDESPMAYKPIEEITTRIGPTAEIIERIIPVYNFKATE